MGHVPTEPFSLGSDSDSYQWRSLNMGEQLYSNSLQSKQNSASTNILGDFCIENRRYLVIYPKHHHANSTEGDLDIASTYLINSIVGQLNIYGKDCVIVEVERYSLEEDHSDVMAVLTERESQIVQLIAQGLSNKQIAKRLQISEWTVSTHLRRIFAKLGVDSRAAMVYRCSSLLNNIEKLIE
jgi:RNA polymerase sigma factor (sigma-70 family)